MSERTVVSERRIEVRKRPLSLVYVELSSANGGMLRDLSELGFAMRAMMPMRVGESTPFSFSLNAVTRLEGQCKVLWVEDDGRVVGMQFTEVPANLRDQVRAWLVQRQEFPPPPSPATPGPHPSHASTMEELREEIRTVGPRTEVPERTEPTLPKPDEKRFVVEEVPPEAKFADESAFTRLPKMEIAKPAEESAPDRALPASPETIPVLESLPPLDPLPALEEAGFTSNVHSPKPWLNRAVVWLAIRMMLFFALVAFVFVYHRPVGNAIIWLGQKIAAEEPGGDLPLPKSEIKPPAPEASPNPAASDPTSAVTTSPVPDAASDKTTRETPANTDKKADEVPPVIENSPASPTKNPLPPAPVPLSATKKITTFAPTVPANTDGGQQEYSAALEILKGKNGEAGLQEGVRLLWVAVEKGNSGAEVTLAELYRRGHGVARNCDQTKVLLTAAAKKGNAEAQKRLDQFLAEGCE